MDYLLLKLRTGGKFWALVVVFRVASGLCIPLSCDFQQLNVDGGGLNLIKANLRCENEGYLTLNSSSLKLQEKMW